MATQQTQLVEGRETVRVRHLLDADAGREKTEHQRAQRSCGEPGALARRHFAVTPSGTAMIE